MVFEQLFAARWLERRPSITFILGFIYSELGILSALLVFPDSSGLMSIAFTSLLLLPTLNQLLSIEENQGGEEDKFSLKAILRNHHDIFEIYTFLFLGILLSFSIFSLYFDEITTVRLFDSQLAIIGISGYSSGAVTPSQQWNTFVDILQNNFKVLMVCLLFSLMYGAGSILFLVWNASVWGTIFGYIARASAAVENYNPLAYFVLEFLSVFPHTLVEASSYFLAVIGGGIISKAMLRERVSSPRFMRIMADGLVFFAGALVLVFLGAYLEVYVFDKMAAFSASLKPWFA